MVKARLHRQMRTFRLVFAACLLLSVFGTAKCGIPIIGGILNAIAKRKQPDPAVRAALESIEKQFSLDSEKLFKIKEEMVHQMKAGLQKNGNSPMLMLPTHLRKLPSGGEQGSFLALDLGGTNFRVLKVNLQGHGKVDVKQAKHRIAESMMYAPGKELFSFFAEKVKEMVPEAVGKDCPRVPLGFTFSFPVQQSAINVGRLVRWTKGFTCPDVVGEDVVALLQQALDDHDVNVEVVALVNDTPGTMFAGAYKNPKVAAGLILGTGTNLCFKQSVSKASKLYEAPASSSRPSVVTWFQAPYAGKHEEQIINTEWGGFDSTMRVLPLLAYDVMLDAKSVNPGEHLYEKMISGMFLGELVRLVASELIAKELLFEGQVYDCFIKPGTFTTEVMSKLECNNNMNNCKKILREIGIDKVSNQDVDVLKKICSFVSSRAARLTAAGLAAVAEYLNKCDDCLVAVDGTLFLKYPKLEGRIESSLRELLGAKMGVRFLPASDGSGVGAALAAAAATQGA
uniref:Phosphotransferase n=1 Tax=Hanusia phi TaxID=3032 RepID=A0A7S0H5D3_9CRYP